MTPKRALEKALAERNAARKDVTSLTQEIASLRRQIEWFKRQLFGATSERQTVRTPEQGRDMFEAAGVESGAETAPSSDDDAQDDPSTGAGQAEEKKKRKRGKKKRGPAVNDSGLRFDADVPVQDVYLEPEGLDGIPGDELEKVGEHVVCKLVTRRETSHVARFIMPIYKRRETNAFLPVPTPPSVFESSCVDVSFIARMLIDKFIWHMPLNRQHRRLSADGIEVSRSSLRGWVRRAIDLLCPLAEAQWRSVLASDVIMMDETYLRAGRISRGKMRRGVLWPVLGDRGEIVFHYRPDRQHHHVGGILGDWSGVLHSDGYGAYAAWSEAMSGRVAHALCWAHTRRKFEGCKDHEPEHAGRALALIAKMYLTEREARADGTSGVALLAARHKLLAPAMAAFWEWHGTMLARDWLPKDPFYQALCYAGERRAGLEVCLGHAGVRLDTNELERQIRPIATGRRNWLFAWSEAGARDIATIQSLLLTCQLQCVDVWTWLVDVLQRVALHPARLVEELTPRRWPDVFGAAPLGSVVSQRPFGGSAGVYTPDPERPCASPRAGMAAPGQPIPMSPLKRSWRQS